MCGLFSVKVWADVKKLREFTIYAASIRGALSKVSRVLASSFTSDEFMSITVITVLSKEHPDKCHKRRFFERGGVISPWIDFDEVIDEY